VNKKYLDFLNQKAAYKNHYRCPVQQNICYSMQRSVDCGDSEQYIGQYSENAGVKYLAMEMK
jgi:hypothetical protein